MKRSRGESRRVKESLGDDRYLRACFNMSLLSFVFIGYGTAPNSRHTVAMSRRMSPILNGMETDKFKPDFSQEDRNPTSILLSHVYDLKGIHKQKNTIILPVLSSVLFCLLYFFSFSFLTNVRYQECHQCSIYHCQFLQNHELSNACVWLHN